MNWTNTCRKHGVRNPEISRSHLSLRPTVILIVRDTTVPVPTLRGEYPSRNLRSGRGETVCTSTLPRVLNCHQDTTVPVSDLFFTLKDTLGISQWEERFDSDSCVQFFAVRYSTSSVSVYNSLGTDYLWCMILRPRGNPIPVNHLFILSISKFSKNINI